MKTVFNDESIKQLPVERLAPFLGCKIKVGTELGGYTEIMELDARRLYQIGGYSHVYTVAPILRPLSDLTEAEAFGLDGMSFDRADHTVNAVLTGEISKGYELAIKPWATAKFIRRFLMFSII